MSVEIVNLKISHIPGIAVVYGGVGRPVDNNELIEEFKGRWKSEEEGLRAIASLEGSGIIRRYKPVDGKLFKDAPGLLRPETIGAVTALTGHALKANGWDKADLLIGITSFPPDEKSEWVKEVAKNCGIPEIAEVNATCNGSALALVEALRNPVYEGSKVVVTTHEPLPRFINPDDFMSQGIFGSGGASIAFERDRFEVFSAITTVSEDTDGVIRVPRAYGMAPSDIELLIKNDWFKIAVGSENIVTYKQGLVRIELPEPKGNPFILEMDGPATARYFTKLVADSVAEGLKDYFLNSPGGHPEPINLVVGHQPSKPVFNLVGRRVQRMLDEMPEMSGIKMPEMPWVLKDAKMSNISSGTFLVAFAELLNRIEEGKPFMGVGYGVGSSSSIFSAQYIR